jgi:hypothetical protein
LQFTQVVPELETQVIHGAATMRMAHEGVTEEFRSTRLSTSMLNKKI